MNQPESKNGKHSKLSEEAIEIEQPAHRHYLRDRKGRKRVEQDECPRMPTVIPLSQSPDIQMTLSQELNMWHLIVRIPAIKWVDKFDEVLTTIVLNELPLTISINNSDSDQYLIVQLRFDQPEVEQYVDVWGKILWVSQMQLSNKLIKKTPKRINDQGCNIVKIKVLDIKSDIFVDLFLQHNRSDARQYQGLINQGNTCYMNSYLQMLFHISCLRHLVFQIVDTTPGKFPATLQNVFYRLAHDNKPVSTEQLSKSYGWSKKEAWVQQDIQQFSCLFFQVLERKINQQKSLTSSFNQLFEGELIHYVECIDVSNHLIKVDYRSESVERFIDLQLSVEGTGNLLESLNHFTGYELLQGDNMYFAEQYGKQRARKGIIISKLPPVVMLQLKRFEYNPFTEKNEKILSRYTYPESFDFSEIVHKPTPIYKLYAVLVHQGEKASSGHYYAYIRLKDKWYKFNDEIVKESCEREVFQYNFGGILNVNQLDQKELVLIEKTVPIQSTAYMLVYYNSEMEEQIFAQENFVPQWLKEQNEAKTQDERLRKLKSEIIGFNVTDWSLIKQTKVTSCGLLRQINKFNYDSKYDKFVRMELPKEQSLDEYIEQIRHVYGVDQDAVSFWLLQESADKEILLNPYVKKESPTIHDLFRENNNTSLLILTKTKTKAIHYNDLERTYVMKDDRGQLRGKKQRTGELDMEYYKQNELYVMIIKLYLISPQNQASFTFDDYILLHKTFTYEELMTQLKLTYQQDGFTCSYYLENKGYYDHQLIDESSFVGIENTKSRLLRVIVQKVSDKANKPTTLTEYLTTERQKICVHIRSEDYTVDQTVYLDKNMDIFEVRRYIFENLSTEGDFEGPQYMLIKTRQSKSSKAMNQAFSGNLEHLTRFDKTIIFDKSTIKFNEREDNSIISLVYRYKGMSKSEPLSIKIAKNTTTEMLIRIIEQMGIFKECLTDEKAEKIRLVLLDNLEEKVIRIMADNSEIVSVLNKSKCHMYVESDQYIVEDAFTVFCHHKTKTGQYLPNPFVLRCAKQTILAELRHLIIEYCSNLSFGFDGKIYKLLPTKVKFNIFPKGSSVSRSAEIFEDSAESLAAIYASNHEICVEVTHMAISKQIQSMKLNV